MGGCRSKYAVDQGDPVEVGAPRSRPQLSDQQQFHEREQEAELSTSTGVALPPAILKKLSRQSSKSEATASLGSFRKNNSDGREASKDRVAESAPTGRFMNFRGNTNMSVDSQMEFADASQTIIIFDWDDTLCPSTCMKPQARFDKFGRLKYRLGHEARKELRMLSNIVVPLLRKAMTMGKVILVTNAKAPWVDISCRSFLPQLEAILKEIPTIYALELVKAKGLDDFDPESGCLLTETKARAMKEAVSQFYSRYPGQSWKNIVSIGDAYFEHDAIRQVVASNLQEKRCRTKTIKLLEGPTVAGMVVQLSIINSWLPKIVTADSDIDIDMSAEEDQVNKWVELYGDVT
mmetsp:Transcript_14360/g.41266  ORF Transcript_14360/g.41266 Transcript_14360/m.41266 type:complete len:348 (+) Transcript_14360:166-1209(+)